MFQLIVLLYVILKLILSSFFEIQNPRDPVLSVQERVLSQRFDNRIAWPGPVLKWRVSGNDRILSPLSALTQLVATRLPPPHTPGQGADTSSDGHYCHIFLVLVPSDRQTFKRCDVVNVLTHQSDELCQGGVAGHRGPWTLAGVESIVHCVVVSFGQLGMFKPSEERRDELDMSH